MNSPLPHGRGAATARKQAAYPFNRKSL